LKECSKSKILKGAKKARGKREFPKEPSAFSKASAYPLVLHRIPHPSLVGSSSSSVFACGGLGSVLGFLAETVLSHDVVSETLCFLLNAHLSGTVLWRFSFFIHAPSPCFSSPVFFVLFSRLFLLLYLYIMRSPLPNFLSLPSSFL
jgi:hypothetical protein